MRQLIQIPMIHSPQMIKDTSVFANPKNIEQAAVASGKLAVQFWKIVEKGLTKFTPKPGQTF
jgi:hypothetical protein